MCPSNFLQFLVLFYDVLTTTRWSSEFVSADTRFPASFLIFVLTFYFELPCLSRNGFFVVVFLFIYFFICFFSFTVLRSAKTPFCSRYYYSYVLFSKTSVSECLSWLSALFSLGFYVSLEVSLLPGRG